MASGCLYLPFIYSFSTKFEIFFDLLIFLSFYFVNLEPYDTMPPFITMLENEYSTLILFSFSTKNRAIGLALLTLVLLFYTPGTERQNKLHPYEDVKSNNFSVCNVFISYNTLISNSSRHGSSRLVQNNIICFENAAAAPL